MDTTAAAHRRHEEGHAVRRRRVRHRASDACGDTQTRLDGFWQTQHAVDIVPPMGRRDDDDGGVIGEVTDIAMASPILGGVLGVFFALFALALHLFGPDLMPEGTGPLSVVFATLVGCLSAVAFLMSGVGAVRCLATGRDLLGRERKRVEASPAPRAAVPASGAVATASPEVPACPRCRRPMARRVARSGPTAGRPFWGCTGFPACRGTVGVAVAESD